MVKVQRLRDCEYGLEKTGTPHKDSALINVLQNSQMTGALSWRTTLMKKRITFLMHRCAGKRPTAVSCTRAKLPESCLTLGGSPPGSSVHGVSRQEILEWVAMPSSRGCSRPRHQTYISCTGGRVLNHAATSLL